MSEGNNAPLYKLHMRGMDDATKQKLQEAIRFAASRSVMSSDDELRVLASLSLSSDIATALCAVIEGFDFWDEAPHDREPPRDAIRRARAALGGLNCLPK